VHFQIKGREWRSIPWLIDSYKVIGPGASEGEIKEGTNFEGRELDVKEEERM
jgi:hypothetical protein